MDTLTVSQPINVTSVNDVPVQTAGTVAPLTVLEDTDLVSLGLTGLAFGPGGGSDEASQTLTYTVTGLPTALGNVYLSNGTTLVALNTTYTLAQLHALKFKPTANANGSGSLTFTVQDNGGTANGGVDSLTVSQTINVTSINDAPTGASSKTVTTAVNTPYVFTVGDFGFTDPEDGNALLAVKITAAPGIGSLTDDGVTVTTATFVSAADIAAGKLKYTPANSGSGSPYATLSSRSRMMVGRRTAARTLTPPRKLLPST